MSASFQEDYFREAFGSIQNTLQAAAANSAFYQALFAEHSVDAHGVLDWESFLHIPLTYNRNLIERPLDFLVVPRRSIRAVGLSSGKNPKVVFANEVSGERAERLTAEEKLGLAPGDHIAMLLYTNNIAPSATPRKWEARGISYVVISQMVAKHNAAALLEFLKQTSVRAIRSTPNFMLTLTRVARQVGFEPRRLELKFITVTGSPLPENTREYLEEVWQTEIIGLWGCNEIGVMGIECRDRLGYHVDAEACFVEALSLDLQHHCQPSEIGQAVVTKLRHDPIILIRYVLGNLIRFADQPCDCPLGGRKVQVLGRPAEVVRVGRKQVPIYPHKVREALACYPQLSGRYRLVVDSKDDADWLTFEIHTLVDSSRLIRGLEERISICVGLQQEVAAGNVRIDISLQDPGMLTEEWGVKLGQSFVDLREQ